MPEIILTETELIVSDYTLCNLIPGTSMGISHRMSGITININTTHPDKADEIIRIVQGSNNIRNFLLQEGYTICTNHSTHHDLLTEKGLLAMKKGGHANYVKWHNKQMFWKRIEDFPSKKWYIYSPIIFILGLLSDRYLLPIRSIDAQQYQQQKSTERQTPFQSKPKISSDSGDHKLPSQNHP